MATKNEASAGEQPPLARPRKEWHEEMGDVLWWRLPIMEPPHSHPGAYRRHGRCGHCVRPA